MLNLSYLNPFHGILQDFPQNEGRKTSTDSVELGGMTKNLYHGIFLNYTGFTVYDGIFIFHACPGVNHIFYWLRKNCSRLTYNAIF